LTKERCCQRRGAVLLRPASGRKKTVKREAKFRPTTEGEGAADRRVGDLTEGARGRKYRIEGLESMVVVGNYTERKHQGSGSRMMKNKVPHSRDILRGGAKTAP